MNIHCSHFDTSLYNFQVLKLFCVIECRKYVLGILLIFSIFFWLQFYRNGFGFSGTINVCNWHPLLMTITFTYLFANSILHFRNFRNIKKKKLKKQHLIIHSCIIFFGLIGVWTGLNSNVIAKPPIPKFYSFHSWLGIVTVIMFLSQFASGFVTFFYPKVAVQYKKAIMPYHIFIGTLTFILSIVTSVLGISEKIMFALNQQDNYMPTEGLYLNFVAFLLIFYGVMVVYILIKPEYKRPPKPKDVVTHIANI
ncbi:putative cytochrome b561 isoform X1 [Sipha flava]|uniref:Cytochrome b561 isoform X1 n=2 Tax=Sipha flava TaxID=143950 RepID=A0A8B8GGI2_9HEMI|nr:putative cytochrome b561 isoform X1 [Sipha flava]